MLPYFPFDPTIFNPNSTSLVSSISISIIFINGFDHLSNHLQFQPIAVYFLRDSLHNLGRVCRVSALVFASPPLLARVGHSSLFAFVGNVCREICLPVVFL
ncbi:hypothetical protein C1H46_017470 [Malus baccata]|uniref:Uncharacterized protein n=1 Tax=Malus baccata TaxID=106549 RepID=A0A540MDW6_MALBA|nr:hypothetical protein C1H46_017470 [Malus baccata]